MFQQRPVWRYLRVTGRVKLWVSGLLPVVSTATVIRKQSLERHYVTAEVQHRAQNKRHHFQRRESSCRSFGGTHKWISATRVQFIWTRFDPNELHNKHWMGGGSCDGDSFTAETHIREVHFLCNSDYTDMKLSSAVLPGLGVKQSQALQKMSCCDISTLQCSP